MIKLFAWEPHVLRDVAEKREDELKQLKKGRLLSIAMSTVNLIFPLLAKISTFATYVSDINRTIVLACSCTSI